jgi:hypothetical protein
MIDNFTIYTEPVLDIKASSEIISKYTRFQIVFEDDTISIFDGITFIYGDESNPYWTYSKDPYILRQNELSSFINGLQRFQKVMIIKSTTND